MQNAEENGVSSSYSLAEQSVEDIRSEASSRRRTYPAIQHFAVLSAFFLPVALIPYFLTRRQLTTVRQTIVQLEHNTGLLRRDLNIAVSELAARRDESHKLRALLHEMMEETDDLRAQAEQNEAGHLKSRETIRCDLLKLSEQVDLRRTEWSILRGLGISLADIAAFMHEVELEMGLHANGKDLRGVEQLRLLALKMQNLPQNRNKTPEDARPDSKETESKN